MTAHLRRSASRAGFSLVEILVVIVIITILAGIVTVSVVHKPAEARIAATRMQVQNLKSAVQLFITEQGHPPTQEQGLEALVSRPTLPPVPERYPPGGYLDSTELPKDAWRHPFIYLAPGRKGEPFEVISYGSDGEPGGDNDASDISSSGAG